MTFAILITILCLISTTRRVSADEEAAVTLADKYRYEHDGGRLDINIVSLEENIEKVCDRLRRLDTVLTNMYEDPPVGGGEEFMRLSRTYNQACLDLLYFCSMDKHKALKAAEKIVDHGGPKFMDVEINEEKMKENFKWDEEALHGMYVVLKNTHEHWYDLWKLYTSLP
uniref:Prolyl 4-hydroxylase alpha-subunit N-terminal domain-containing protein n=1 Tax=Cuerna arida TaxID=1464854 RepID=A0A1B6EZ07_9HEMI